MPEVRDIAQKVRSKNAGPFWVTIDVFCGTPEAYARIRDGLQTSAAAAALGVPTQELKRFDNDDWTLEPPTFGPEVEFPTDIAVTPNTTGSEEYQYQVTAIAEENNEESLPGISTAFPVFALTTTVK